jgi:hypothetical protein
MNMTNDDKVNDNHRAVSEEFSRLIQMLSQYLDFHRWKFELTHIGVSHIIYRSNQCQIRFRMEQDRAYESPALYINYGRLHAPPDQSRMMWMGEDCYCWHELGKVLNFLDGLSPSDVTNSEFRLPRIMREFSESSGVQNSGPEYLVKMHAYFWNQYGPRLFDLFDVQQPHIWEEYRDFLRQYYNNRDKKRPALIKPPLYNVC